ncbi:hypothetical protein B0H14DRAFT_3446455 [Mycena olivaceomarginata]|nr:hypothetical protein B0H14DRAFT_3446455 [Mycena olivaceomarginata]
MFGIGGMKKQHVFLILPPWPEICEMSCSPRFCLPFSSVSVSPVLLVCKAWLRVATPLLYNVVFIRSKAQAEALAVALRGLLDPGRFIKKLRVEGGFGAHMGHILRSAPNITDLFISTAIHSPDTTSGLDTQNLLKNKWVMQLFQALADAMDKKWTNLTTIVLASDEFTLGAARANFQNASLLSKTIQVNPAVRTLEIRSTEKWLRTQYMGLLKADPRLTPLVKFTGSKIRVYIAPAPVTKALMILLSDPTFRPMASSPVAVSEIVWDRVRYIGMISDEVPPTRSYTLASVLSKMDGDHYAMKKNSRRLKFLLVSKIFYVTSDSSLRLFSADSFHGIGDWRSLIDTMTRLSGTTRGPNDSRSASACIPSLECMFTKSTDTAIRRSAHLRLWRVMCDAFEALPNTAGARHTEMSGFRVKPNDFRMPSDPTPFIHFTVLRSLKWNSLITFSKGTPGQFSAALPALESLDVESGQIFSALEQFDLPMLRRFVLDEWIKAPAYDAFLVRHGHKLADISLSNWSIQEASTIFEHCPALLDFELRLVGAYGDDENYPPGLTCPTKHHSLVKAVVQKSPAACRNAHDDHAEWTKFCANSAWADFPALRRIEVAPLEWPTNEHAISKGSWVGWAAELLTHNI